MVLKRSFCPGYLFSFVVGIGFGKMIDVHNAWLLALPNTLPLNIIYFFSGFLLMCSGICLANNCMLPIIPTDIFPRDLSAILKKNYKTIKTSFDLCCLTTTVILSLTILHRFYGIGIGTIFCCIPDRKNSLCHSALHRQSCRILPSDRERTSHASKKRAPYIKQVMNAVALLRSVIIDDMSTPIRFIKIQGDRIPLQGFPVSFYMLLFHLFTIFNNHAPAKNQSTVFP
ncbi:MAG: DUF6198 family protein [Lachnospiraceae bacterium]